ncbi:wall-associated receptor kinase 2-like isoform X1 [Humulus lupulus]|uniref:wall-associated receptor kinase 2-like isoform X1 n=1 Tax=Humulus lupulus TaxID=3486 RepID=UPI002B4136A7|nr:wall-associated receptor kinase 2-like isoform X1 [Humulus lupulus]
MAIQKLIVLLFGVLLIVATKPTKSEKATNNNTITIPGCPQYCGSVKIPYPFGTTKDCYYNTSFRLTCNQTFNPPKPFFHGSNVTILEILLEHGEIRAGSYVSRDCYDKSGKLMRNDSIQVSYTMSLSQFPLSKRNKFVAVGCNTLGVVAGDRGRPYGTGCVALCKSTNDVVDGSCEGIGCCQMEIAQGVLDFGTGVGPVLQTRNHSMVHDFNPCGYAFVAEENSYNFSRLDLVNLKNKETSPVVLDWAVGNLTCERAKARSNLGMEYACRAQNSQCLNSTNGPGYRCKCLKGFEGNPYLLDGCQDINECVRSNPCHISCHNMIGGFKCSCRKGFRGDGKKGGTGCTRIDYLNNFQFVAKLSIGLGICTGFLILVVGSSWIYWGAKKRRLVKLKYKFFQQNGGLLLRQQLQSHHIETVQIYTADELEKATQNYDQSRVIGQGGYGTVYKGILPGNKIVAIKKSKISNTSQIDQFINEVIVLSQINHRNVVKLLGCCLESEVPLLVYEYITNGTLSDHLCAKLDQYCPLSWKMRLKIATETAGAIAYFHSSISMSIIHRDIKTANILLDDNYIAKVSDFGASRLVPLDQTQLTTLVQGTLGYLDPEYFHTSQLTEKSDVYSFGVVLAELLTGEKALSFERPEKDMNLALYFISSMKEDRLLQILDKNNMTIVDEDIQAIKVVANLAKWCLRVRGEERPTMKEVASELEGLIHKEMHSWGHANQEGLNQHETEYLLESSYLHGHGSCNDTNARFNSMNNDNLQSYRCGR